MRAQGVQNIPNCAKIFACRQNVFRIFINGNNNIAVLFFTVLRFFEVSILEQKATAFFIGAGSLGTINSELEIDFLEMALIQPIIFLFADVKHYNFIIAQNIFFIASPKTM